MTPYGHAQTPIAFGTPTVLVIPTGYIKSDLSREVDRLLMSIRNEAFSQSGGSQDAAAPAQRLSQDEGVDLSDGLSIPIPLGRARGTVKARVSFAGRLQPLPDSIEW